MNKKLVTKYAPAERLSDAEMMRQIKIFENNETMNKFLSKIPAIFIIVNKYRQIVYMNKGALNFTGLESVSSIIGKRPGEVIGCIHSDEQEGGCGTTESCTYCGAVNAVLSSQKGVPAMEEARLILGPDEDAYDLRIWASPLEVESEKLSAVTIQDIRHEKRRHALERVFFHDILNTITGLFGTLQILINYGTKVDQASLLENSFNLVRRLTEEVRSQQILNSAETGIYQLHITTFNSLKLLHEIADLYRGFKHAINKNIKISEDSDTLEIRSDRVLIQRIISNMLKNALEETKEQGTVTLGCRQLNTEIVFWVHNSGYIPKHIQLQIFQRSFSTKGANRGLGTWSMKLLSSLLNGNVSFSSSEKKGTIFRATFPLHSE